MTCRRKDISGSWSVFRRQMWVGLLVTVAIIIVPLLTHGVEISETRIFREVMGRMPFANVTVTGQKLTGGEMAVWGTMVKRRCEYRGLSAYVERGGVWVRAWIDTRPEDTLRPGGDRPASPDAQTWGVWSIRILPPDPAPRSWRIFAHHLCPRGPQVNLFAQGEWTNAD